MTNATPQPETVAARCLPTKDGGRVTSPAPETVERGVRGGALPEGWRKAPEEYGGEWSNYCAATNCRVWSVVRLLDGVYVWHTVGPDGGLGDGECGSLAEALEAAIDAERRAQRKPARWTVHTRDYTRVHVAIAGDLALVAHATHTRPPWQWAVVRRDVWLSEDCNPWRLDGVAEAIGGAGSWQRARARAEEAACAKP